MALTGFPDGPPVLGPLSLPAILARVTHVLATITARVGERVDADPGLVVTGRAAAMGLSRRGRTSAGGVTRLLRSGSGWCAVSMARPDDFEMVPAVVGYSDIADPWEELSAAALSEGASSFAARLQLLGVPAAALPIQPYRPDRPWRVTRIAAARPGLRLDGALVVDLSSLWAGPLCAHLLGQAGATVVKVESTRRPDGARYGNTTFFDSLHAGHQNVAVDFSTASGRAALRDLIGAADIVIEASRPRALANLSLAPESLRHRPGTVWISITGYGRQRPELVAFGDDAAVAGGLVGWTRETPIFCADAIADPLTGLTAALAAAASVTCGGGQLIDLAMCDVAASFAYTSDPCHGAHPIRTSGTDWILSCPLPGDDQAVLPACAPEFSGTAPTLGADTDQVLATLRPSPSIEVRDGPLQPGSIVVKSYINVLR